MAGLGEGNAPNNESLSSSLKLNLLVIVAELSVRTLHATANTMNIFLEIY